MIKTEETDLVYLWVDASDPVWSARKRAATGEGEAGSETTDIARWVSNDELKFSLRSVEKFVPWVRRIFIVTDGQVPGWLDTTDPRVRVVDHTEIMPAEALPCYNSSVIEYFLHRIPGLSERFLFANDDHFFGAPLGPEFFFAPDGFPIVRLKRKAMGKARFVVKRALKVGFGYYRRALFWSAKLVERQAGKYLSGIPHHNVDAYLRDDYGRVMDEIFGEETLRCRVNRTRTEGDFHRSAVGLWTLATGRAHAKYVTSHHESLRIGVHKPDFAKLYERARPKLFCLNDSQHATDADRTRIRPFLETLFPEKSSFEK